MAQSADWRNGFVSDENMLKPLYTLHVDPSGTLGASDGVAFSNDGSILMGSDNLANAYLYRASDGRFKGVSVSQTSIAFSGKQNSDGEINAADFSVDDSMFVTGSNDTGAKVWDTATGKLLYHLNDGTNTDGASFSPDGKWLATAADGDVHIYDVNNNFNLVKTLPGSADEVNSVEWSPNSQYLVTGSDEDDPRGTVLIYNTDDWTLDRGIFPTLDGSIKSVAVSPDNQLIAISGGRQGPDNEIPGGVQILDLKTGELVADLPHQGNLLPLPLDDQDKQVKVEDAVWSRDGNYLITSGLIDGAMRIWRRDDWSMVGWAQAQEPNRAIEYIDVSPDNLIAVGGDDGTVKVYQFNPPEIKDPFQSVNGADGVISIEVENNDSNVSQGGLTWKSLSDSLASGGTYLEAVPLPGAPVEVIDQNFEPTIAFDPVVDAPKLDYRVNFAEAGTYYIWARGREGMYDGGDTFHIGLDGQLLETSTSIDLDDAFSWEWSNQNRDDAVATINVETAGLHTLNVVMREAGVAIDKIVLTTDPNYDPSQLNGGLGTHSSLRSPSPKPNPIQNKLFGTSAADKITGSASVDIIKGKSGNDILEGLAGDDIINGGWGKDTINGGKGNDRLEGGHSSDTINGGDGDDVIFGGLGKNDRLTGGSGRDTFAYSSVKHGGDTITDFKANQDLIDVSAIFKDSSYANTNAMDNLEWVQTGADTEVKIHVLGDDDDQLKMLATLSNVDATTLSANNFIV